MIVSSRTRVAAYLRRSRGHQEMSIQRQRADVGAYCKSRGYIIVAEFVDDAIEGPEINRPGLQAMTAAAARGEFAGIVCVDTDRLYRNDTIEQGFILYPIRKADVWIETVIDGRVDLDTLGGRLQNAIKGEGAKLEVIKNADRALSGRMLRVNAGRLPLPRRTYGYRRDPARVTVLLVCEIQSSVVLQIFEWYAAGRSPYQICRELNARAVPSPTGRLWTRQTIRQILRN